MIQYLPYYLLFAGGWSVMNGVLHDFFVLKTHRTFDKELMRLLTDGHILIFGGIFYFLAFYGIKSNQVQSYYMAITTSIFLIGYCLIIFKMLPAYGMIAFNLIALIWAIIGISKVSL